MANTSALLGNLLCTNADINYYTQQSIFWNSKYEANMAKLEKQVKFEEDWYEAYDKCMAGKKDGEEDVTLNGKTFARNNECAAIQYADLKVTQYDAAKSEELADLDIEYDTMKCMYDTLLEQMRAKKESEKTATSTAAQDTGLLNAG